MQRQLLRNGLAFGGAAFAFTAAQGLHVHSSYAARERPAPDGPQTGTELARDPSAAAQRLAAAAHASLLAKREAIVARLREAASAGDAAASEAAESLSAALRARATEGAGAARSASAAAGPMRRNIVFLGDSLVTGVGCAREGSPGPRLPRHVARVLSDRLGVDVHWSAFGITGADVRRIHGELLPRLRDELRRRATLVAARADCLLYTSPSPRDGLLSRMPSSA